MKPNGKTSVPLLVLVLIGGAALGGLLNRSLTGGATQTAADNTATNREPLYWVAPMDSDYRRDKPGKSPMGMDLVAVYAEDGSADQDSPGTIRISPEVINNLGVRTEESVERQLLSTVRTVGYVQYNEEHLIHIHPRVEGWVEDLYVKAAGDPVSENQPLYALYSPELVNAQEELLLAINRDNTRLIQAAVDRLRALQLSPDFIAALRRDKQVRQTITFRSPQRGVVDNLNIREGFYVKPDTTLMSIGSLDDVWVEAEVFERQAALIEVGMPATMTLEYLPGTTWEGSVDYIYPTVSENTRTLRVRLRFENADRALKPNMFAQVTLQAIGDDPSLVVPRESLIRTGEQNRVVLALGDGRYKSIAVRVGRIDEQYAEILAGLNAGDLVVSSAQFLLDSESSKTSDFKRMHSGAADGTAAEHAGVGGQNHD